MLRKITQFNFKVLPILLCGIIFLLCGEEFSFGLPEVQEVVSGTAQISNPNSTTLQINADSNTIINYSSFNISENESVVINLPSADGQLLNRVLGNSASQLLGNLNSNGLFVLVNPSGIYIGPKATIDAGSVIMSTRDISNADFSNGNYLFQKLTPDQLNKLLLNEGTITISKGGFGVLIAGGIENKGKIIAPTGTIALAAGDAVRLDIAKRGLISVAIEKETSSNVLDAQGNAVTDQIKNTGTLEANGGTVLLDAASISGIFLKGVNLAGYVNANKVENVDGVLRIVASQDVSINATVKATNIEVGSSPGKIPEKVEIAGGSLEAEKNITILAKKDITINANLTAQGIIHLEGQKIIDLTSALKANTLKLIGQEFLISTNAVNLEVTKTLNDFVISKSSTLGDLVALEGDGVKLTYPITSHLTLKSDNPIRTTGTAIISAQKVSLLSNKFGEYSTPVRISADELVIHRLSGTIEIAQSTDQGGNISIRGPPTDSFSIQYNKNASLTLKATNGAITLASGVTLSANNLTLTASQGIHSLGSLLANNTLTLFSNSDITSLGTIKAANLIEQGASFRVGGTYQVRYASVQNADNAINLATGNYGNGSGNDPDGGGDSEIADVANIVINSNAIITLVGNLILRADSDTNGSGAITMTDNTSSIVGGGFNLTLFASQASTLRSITGVGTLSINESQTNSVPLFSLNNNLTMVNYTQASANLDAGAGLTHTVSGNWTHTGGTYFGASSKPKFTGASATINTYDPANSSFSGLETAANVTITLASNVRVNNTFTVGDGTIITASGGVTRTFQVDGDSNLAGSLTIGNANGDVGYIQSNGGATPDLSALTAGSTVTIGHANNGGSYLKNVGGGALTTVINMTINGTGSYFDFSSSGSPSVNDHWVKGNLTINDGAYLVAESGGGGASLEIDGNLDIAGSTHTNWNMTNALVTFGGIGSSTWSDASAGQNMGAVTIDGDSKTISTSSNVTAKSITIGANDTFNITSDTLTLTNTGTVLTLNVGGTFTTTSSTVTYTGTTTATNITTVAYNNLTLTPTAATTYSLTAILTGGNAIVGTLTINANATLDATSANNYNLTAATITIAASGTYTARASSITVSGTTGTPFSNSGTFTAGTSTVTYTGNNGFGNTTVAGISYYNLTLNNSLETYVLGGDTTVSNVLTITAGTLDASSRTITLSGTTGTPFVNSGTFTASTSTVSYTGNNVAVNGNTTIANLTYNSLTLNNAAETYVLAGNATVINGNLTITAGTLDVVNGQNYPLTVGGNWSNSGVFKPRTGTVFFNKVFNSDPVIGTQTLNSGGQNANTQAFNALTHSGTGTLQLVTNSLKVLVFSQTAGTFNMNDNGTLLNMNVGGAFSLSASTTFTKGGTLTFDGAAGVLLTDSNATKQNLGNIVIGDGVTAKTITLGSDIAADNVTISLNGTLDASNSNYGITVSGNWLNSGSFAARFGTVTFNAGVGIIQTINSGGTNANTQAFKNLTHSGAGTLQLVTNSLKVGATFNNNAGTFDMNAKNMNVGGAFVLGAGTTFLKGGTVTLETATAAVITDSNATKQDLGNLTIGDGVNTKTVTLGSLIAVTNLTISLNGTLDASNSNYVITVSGNWLNSGTFTSRSGTVTFNATTTGKTITSGSVGSSFYGLTFNGVGGGWTLQDNMTVSNVLTITAGTLDASSKIITLSGTTGTPFVNSGTFTASASSIKYTGNNLNGNTTVANVTYNNLILDAAETFVLAGITTVNGNLTITAGTLDVVSYALTVGGNLSNSGTFMAREGTVTFNGAVDTTQTLNSGSSAFYNLSHSGAGTLQLTTNALTVAGTFTNSNGTFDANGIAATYTGLVTVSGGTYQAGAATQTFNGGLTISGGTFSGSTGAVDVNGNLTLSLGTLTAPSGAFTVSGNWVRTGGTFTPGTGTNTVTFDGLTTTIISGNTTFNNFKVTTAGKELRFTSDSTQIITGTLTLTGISGGLIKLRSTVAGSQWKIDPRGTRAVSYVDVKDSNNVNSLIIDPMNSINSGGNINWFPAPISTTTTTTTTTISNNNETIFRVTRVSEVKIILNVRPINTVIQQMKMDTPQNFQGSFQGVKMAEFKSTIKDLTMPTSSFQTNIQSIKETPASFQSPVQTMQEMKEFKTTESMKEEGIPSQEPVSTETTSENFKEEEKEKESK